VLRDRLPDWIIAVLGSGLQEFKPVGHRLATHLDCGGNSGLPRHPEPSAASKP